MNSVVKKLVTVFLSLFLLAYVGYQAYLALYNPLRTQRAESTTVRDFISANGFILHDETLITAGVSGVVDYTRSDGERVPVGGEVAKIYSSASDAEVENRVQVLDAKIARLEEDGTSEQTAAVDMGALDDEIGETFIGLADDISGSHLDTAEEKGESLSDLLNKKQLATGEASDFSKTIASLQSEAAALSKQTAGPKQIVKSEASGCFVSRVDGYEGAYNTANVLNIHPDDVDRLFSMKPAVRSGAIGKIVSQYQWYIVCNLNSDNAQMLKVGSSVGVQFPLSSGSKVPATVVALNQSGNRYSAVLECDYMTSKLAILRKGSVQIILDNITGIRVDNSLIRVIGDKKGVYVLNGNVVYFKEIVPVYTGNGYTISEIDSTDSGRLQIYDSMITNGDGLYDGKIIK